MTVVRLRMENELTTLTAQNMRWACREGSRPGRPENPGENQAQLAAMLSTVGSEPRRTLNCGLGVILEGASDKALRGQGL